MPSFGVELGREGGKIFHKLNYHATYPVVSGHREDSTKIEGMSKDPILRPHGQERFRGIARRINALGPAYRLTKKKQERVEALLAERQERRLTSPECRELKDLLQECDDIMLRCAVALDTLG
jgi:hypothetical protein